MTVCQSFTANLSINLGIIFCSFHLLLFDPNTSWSDKQLFARQFKKTVRKVQNNGRWTGFVRTPNLPCAGLPACRQALFCKSDHLRKYCKLHPEGSSISQSFHRLWNFYFRTGFILEGLNRVWLWFPSCFLRTWIGICLGDFDSVPNKPRTNSKKVRIEWP